VKFQQPLLPRYTMQLPPAAWTAERTRTSSSQSKVWRRRVLAVGDLFGCRSCAKSARVIFEKCLNIRFRVILGKCTQKWRESRATARFAHSAIQYICRFAVHAHCTAAQSQQKQENDRCICKRHLLKYSQVTSHGYRYQHTKRKNR